MMPDEPGLYYDRQGRPIGMMAWARLHNDHAYKAVVQNWVRGWFVSTVWLGLDHSFGDGPPLIFETMIFPPGDEAECESTSSEEYCDRYPTEAAARAGHDQALAWLAEKIGANITLDVSGPLASDAQWDGDIKQPQPGITDDDRT